MHPRPRSSVALATAMSLLVFAACDRTPEPAPPAAEPAPTPSTEPLALEQHLVVVETQGQKAETPARRTSRPAVDKQSGDQGILGALREDPSVALNQDLANGIGGLIGSPATVTGSGGLSARGGGVGGGGAPEGIGGLGTKGKGSGTAHFGAKAERGVVGRGPPMTGDAYNPIAEGGFQAVADAPLSTFSIDVDTASYSNVRRYLAEGSRPPASAVRVEEMLNYFTYDDAAPTNGAPFAAHTEVSECPWATGHRLVRVGIQGREVAAANTPARNLVFLVDVSGSMSSEDRLPLVVRGLELLSSQLSARDRVSMVVYAGAAGVVLPPTSGDRTAVIRAALGQLRSGGSTAGGEGIRAAYALAREHFDPEGINRVILATDGDFNVGTTSEGELVSLIEEERRSGVFLTVLGVGRGNLQDDRLESLADKGNGSYAYIDTYAEMRKVLGEQIGGTLVTIAKDVKLQVEMNPARVSGYRLIGYEDRVLAARDFNDDTKDAGEIGAGHHVTALYEIVPAEVGMRPAVDPLKYQTPTAATAAASSSPELLTVKIRYKEPTSDTSKLLAFPVTDPGTSFAQASADTRWAAAVAGFGMLLRDSPYRGTASWAWALDTAREALGQDQGGYRAEMVRMVNQARGLVSEG